jgi:DNA-binding MarR family transcriptional regulator
MTMPKSGVAVSATGIRLLSPTYAAAFLGLLRAGEVVGRELDHELREAHGISLPGFEILLHLGALSDDGSLRMGQLTAQAPLSQSRVSRLVAELESRGLVARETWPDDTRSVVVSLTEAGEELLRLASETHLDGLGRTMFSRLTRAETAELARLTAKLLGDAAPRTGADRHRATRGDSTRS